MEGSLGRNTARREGKPVSRWEWSDVTTLPPDSWLITWRRGTISVWASVAARLGIQRCHSRSVLENGSPGCWAHAKLPSLPPWPFCSSAHREMTEVAEERLTDVHRMGHPIHLIINACLCRGHSLVSIHVEHKFLHIFCPFRDVCTVLSCSVVFDSCNTMDCSLPGSSVHGDSPGKNTGVGYHTFFQGIFPTQGSNPGLLHFRQILDQLSHQGSPW